MPHIYDTADRAAVAEERETLEAFLDHYRDVMKAKVIGVSETFERLGCSEIFLEIERQRILRGEVEPWVTYLSD